MNKKEQEQFILALTQLFNLISIVVTVFTLSLSWNHFIVPVFNLPKIGLVLSIVIILMYELISFKSSDSSISEILGYVSKREKKEIDLEYAVTNFGVSTFIAIVLLILSFII